MENFGYNFDMRRGLMSCPVCNGELAVVEYRCRRCGTRISGEFEISEFAGLTSEQLHFLKVFLQSRGNLSVVSQVLGVSRPTARARLDDLLRTLGFEVLEEEYREPAVDINEVLDRLERGEITSEEAEKIIRGEA